MNCKVCGNTSTNNTSVSFFRFPKESTKCRDWAERCDLLALYEKHGALRFYKSFRVCSDHFDSKHIVFDGRKKRLLQSAVPQTLITNPPNTIKENSVDEKVFKSEELKIKPVENLCRLCAKENKNLTDIYGWRGKVLNLESKLKYFPLMINKYDVLPLKVCYPCISKVNQFHDFILNCVKAETKLRILLDLEGCDVSNKLISLSTKDQEKVAWDSGTETSLTKTPNLCLTTKINDLPNSICFPGNIEDDYYNQVLQDNFINKDVAGCFCKQPQPENAKTNQLINYTNFIKNVDFSKNVSYKNDYSNTVSRDQSVLESEIQTENDQNFIEETKHLCDICLESFCTIEALSAHSLTHSVQPELSKELVCEICNKVFFSKFELDEHTSKHVEKNYTCKICDKKFHTVAFLEHSFLHQPKNSFDCVPNHRPSSNYSATSKESDEKTALKHFLKSDTSEPSLFHKFNTANAELTFKSVNRKCQCCDKLLKNRQVCLTHKKGCTGNTPYVCKLCGKTFSSKPSLRQHSSVHSNKRLYNCQECGMSFKRKDTLSNHLRIHTGERPFVCKVCGFAFKQRGDCKKHEKNHQKKCEVEVQEERKFQMDVVHSNDGMWDDEINSSLPSYITVVEEMTPVDTPEDIKITGRMIPF